MSIIQTKKQSDLEKRLRLLRQQVYGKESEELRTTQINQKAGVSENLIHRYSDIQVSSGSLSSSESFRTDTVYLHQDLLKILAFASCALGIQLVLFYLLKNNILKLPF